MKLKIRHKKVKKSLIRQNQKYQKKEFKLNQVMRIMKKGNHLIKAKKKLSKKFRLKGVIISAKRLTLNQLLKKILRREPLHKRAMINQKKYSYLIAKKNQFLIKLSKKVKKNPLVESPFREKT